MTAPERIEVAIEALLSYQQADRDGVMVTTSRQAIHEVVDALRALKEGAAPLWQPIETAPKDGTGVLLCCKREQMPPLVISGYWDVGSASWMATSHCELYPPSHWMPLPAPQAPA